MKQTGLGTLEATAPGDREIVLKRVFDAPCQRVYDAYTRPEVMKRWFAPRGWTLATCENDLRPGGAFRFVWRSADGKEMTIRGAYREVVPPARLVHTETFDDPWYPGEALATTVLSEAGGRTTLTTTMLYDSREIRDAVFRSGMDRGVAHCYEQLDQVLAALAARAV